MGLPLLSPDSYQVFRTPLSLRASIPFGFILFFFFVDLVFLFGLCLGGVFAPSSVAFHLLIFSYPWIDFAILVDFSLSQQPGTT